MKSRNTKTDQAALAEQASRAEKAALDAKEKLMALEEKEQKLDDEMEVTGSTNIIEAEEPKKPEQPTVEASADKQTAAAEEEQAAPASSENSKPKKSKKKPKWGERSKFKTREEYYAWKVATQAKFTKGAKEHLEKVKNLPDEEKTAYYAKIVESRKLNKARLQSGLIFPVKKVRSGLRLIISGRKSKANGKLEGKGYDTIKTEAAIFTAAVLEYMCAEVLEVSGNVCREAKPNRKTIKPRDIMIAIRDDAEIDKLVPKTTLIKGAGQPVKEIPRILRKPKHMFKSNDFTSISAGTLYSNFTED